MKFQKASSCDKRRRVYEREYKSLFKKLCGLDKKYKNTDKVKDRIKSNVIKARGKDILLQIAYIENNLGIDENDKINPLNYFCD